MRTPFRLVLWLMALLCAAWLCKADLHTDDTGIVAGLVLIFAAVCTFADPQWPWLWALFWGLCIPLTELMVLGPKRGLPALLALVPAAIGALLGYLLHRALSPASGLPSEG